MVSPHFVDKKIREELEGLEVNPPVEAWLAISDEIGAVEKKSLTPFFTGIAAGISLLIATAFSFWFLVLDKPMQDDMLVSGPRPADVSPLLPEASPVLALNTMENVPVVGSRPMQSTPVPDPVDPVQWSPDHGSLALPSIQTGIPDTSTPLLANRASSAALAQQHSIRVAEGLVDTRLAMADEGGAPRLRFGAHFAPQLNYRFLASSSGIGLYDIPFQSLENEAFSFSAGLNSYVNISARWSIQTGIHYSSMGQHVQSIASFAYEDHSRVFSQGALGGRVEHPQSVVTSFGHISFHDPHFYFSDIQARRVVTRKSGDQIEPNRLDFYKNGVTQVFRMVEIPLIFRLQLFSGGVGLQVKGGFSGNYLIGNDVFLGTDISQKSVGETSSIPNINVAAVGGFALDIPLAGNFSIMLEPTARVLLRPIARKGFTTGNTYPYSVGLQTGITYGF